MEEDQCLREEKRHHQTLTFLVLAKAHFLNNLSSRHFLVKDKVALVVAIVRIFLIPHHHHLHLLMLILEVTRLPLVYLLRFIHPRPQLQLQNNGKLSVDVAGEVLVLVVEEEEKWMKVISMMMIMMMRKEED